MMQQLSRFVFLLLLAVLAVCPVKGQQSANNLQWFEHYFENPPRDSIDDQIRAHVQTIENAQNELDITAQCVALKQLGLLYLTGKNDHKAALENFFEALTLEEQAELHDDKILTYVAIARAFAIQKSYYKSKEFLDRALRQLDKSEHNNLVMEAYVLIDLSKAKIAIGDLASATKDLDDVIRYSKGRYPSYLAEAYFMMGEIEMRKKRYDQAYIMYKDALQINRNVRDRKGEALTLEAIGKAYQAKGDFVNARENFVAALEIQEAMGDLRSKAHTYLSAAEMYYESKNYQRAIANLDLAEALASKYGLSIVLRDVYKLFAKCYKELNNLERVVYYQEHYVEMIDHVEQEEETLIMEKLQSEYFSDQYEQEIEALEKETAAKDEELEIKESHLEQKDEELGKTNEQLKYEKEKAQKLALLVGIVVLLAIFFLLLYYIKRQSGKKLALKNAEIAKQKEELEDLNATKDKFFSILGHDLKGPLNSLSSFTYLLSEHIDSMGKEEIQHLAKDLDKSQKNLYALLENLLEWSRSQTGNIEFTPGQFDIAAVLEENKTLLEGQAKNKEISIINSAEGEIPVMAHKNSITTVVRNLVSNAIKFTPQGGNIELALASRGNEVEVAVQDNGVGMSQEVMQKLFRIDAKHSTKGTAEEKGTGLGLILCKDFVEKNGGRIWVESEPGKGSVFRFTIPGKVR